MSIYLPKDCRTWRYRFKWRGRWYVGSTGQLRREDAELVDRNEQVRVRQSAFGVAPIDPARSPRFSDWAEIYFQDVTTRRRERIKRPDRIDDLLRVLLRFWGAKPKDPKPHELGPYHNLRLVDPLIEPQWIMRFEQWMDARGISGQTKNQYRSTLSQLYRLAAAPAWTKITQVDKNPFKELERDPKVTRVVTLSLEDLRKILETATYHIRLAVAIGLLAHKLRLENILALTWKDHILQLGPQTLPGGHIVYGWIRVDAHKTDRTTGAPLVVPIVKQLHDILVDARARSTSPYVISYRHKPVKDIHSGLRSICRRAGVAYGRFVPNGVTFHTLRHTASTAMADLEIPDAKRMLASGHRSSSALQGYTHLRPVQEIAPRELLSTEFPIADLVTATVRRPQNVPVDHDRQPDQQAAFTPSNDARIPKARRVRAAT